MAKALIIQILEVEIPKRGFLNGGWYSGMQFFNRKFGPPGVIMAGRRIKNFKKLSKNKRSDFFASLIDQLSSAKQIYK